ncbi:TIGR03560 family F420-dependent LLM class oxidoreductase [Kribbella catacumbae]|uniref:TIGR03560 family F420-dependent LLM class oxidoreductase n=1 Tax=Kribbella catacumbae TaxID=460086 RepID=UPI000369E58C|nr:TIGR03560 family F420-dependent LLM class oxidoreductase [Kribbella catacumbae]
MKFNLFLPTGFGADFAAFSDPAQAAERVIQLAQTAEAVGFSEVWLPDHLQTIPPSAGYLFEAWTLLTAIARETTTVRVGQLVTGNGYRNPALQAKMASTLDALSAGRLTFGIGAGWYQPDYDAFGYEFPAAGQRLRELREAVQVIQSLWTEEVTNFSGEFYTAKNAYAEPKGVQEPRIPMMIAGGGEKVTLRIVAEFADACNLMTSPAEIERKLRILRRHADEVGRDLDSIRVTATTAALLSGSDEEAQGQLHPGMGAFYAGDFASYLLYGTAETVQARVKAYEKAGVDELVVGFHHSTDPDAIREFAEVIGL